MVANVAGIDDNSRRSLSALSNANDGAIVDLWADPTTHRLLVDNASTSGNITIGTTTITGGTDKRILYDNAGVVGEYTLTGTGTVVVMATAPTFQTSITGAYLDASEILITDGSKNIVSATVATYPSLTELSYVKGVTSAIQTQINAKGAGTVTSVSVTTANGVSGSVATATTTPAITLTLGAITPTTVNGVTFTGSGSATLALGTKSLTISNTLILAGTDSTTMTFPTTSASIARTDAGQTFTGVSNATSWNFTTPVLGTPTSGTLTNCTGLPAASVVAGTFGTGSYTIDTRLTVPQILNIDNAVTASANAITFTRANRNNVVTNNSAATLTITLSTTSATAGDMLLVQVLDFSAVAQTITWVNTENSTVTVPTTSNASTTLPITTGFKWNAATSKWRCIAKA